MASRTFIDANVLIAAFRGEDKIANRAAEILDDADRVFVTSDMVRLELIPKSFFHQRTIELAFYEEFFRQADILVETTPELVSRAEQEAKQYGLSAIDALLIVAAKQAGATEFVTAEHAAKPICRIQDLRVTSIRS